MIRPLRQRHARMVIVLGVVLPVAFAVGIAGRRAVPEMPSLPDGLIATPSEPPGEIVAVANAFSKSPVQVRVIHAVNGVRGSFVELSAPADFIKPDLLVYWVEGAGLPAVADKLPDQAVLLGGFKRSASLALPATAAKGVLVLYSLADQEVVDVSTELPLQ
jgi:hypothetical protein